MSNIIRFQLPKPPAKCPACRGKGVIQTRIGRLLTTTVCPHCKPAPPATSTDH